jgi:hypothetical protein
MPLIADDVGAWHVEALAGRGITYHDAQSDAVFVDAIGAERPLARGFSWSPMLSLGAIGGTSRFGDARDETVWLGAVGARLNLWRGFFTSFELGAVSSQTPAFSSTYQFVTSLGWSYEHFVVSLRHVSNGGLKGSNYGETMLLAGVSF